jgi:RHS repeat-associated protein
MTPLLTSSNGRGVADLLEVRLLYMAQMSRPTSGVTWSHRLPPTVPTLVFSAPQKGGLPSSVANNTELFTPQKVKFKDKFPNYHNYPKVAANSADDRLSRLAGLSLTGEATPLGQFAWMGSGRLVSLTMPQPGIALSYKHVTGEPVGDAGDPYSGYDRFGRTVDMRWIKTSDSSSLSRIQYGYDKMSRRLWRQDLAAPADTQQDRFYSYDGLGQVTDSTLGNLNINRTSIAGIPTQREAFDYDSIGNWKNYLRQTEGSTTLDQKRTSNRDNQLTELDANSDGLAYDAAGNMTACRPDKDGDWSKGYTIVWDAWNRIVQVKNAHTAATVATYAYDGLTRRTTTTIGSTVRHFYYNNLWKCVEERVGSSTNPDRVYYWSTRPGHRDELLRRDRATSGGALNETLWCLMDYFDPIAITDTSGTIQERYTYSAFGLASILTPTFSPRTTSNFTWNFLFHGQFRDTETGWDNYGYRYYLPWLGRWPSKDLIGEEGGVNLYGMGGNNVIFWIDRLGLAPAGSYPDWGGHPPKPPYAPKPSNGNCWRYACNDPAKPGEPHEPFPGGTDPGGTLTCKDVIDGAKKSGAVEPTNGECPKCYRKIQAVLQSQGGPSNPKHNDYHWYREESDGSWSHKPGHHSPIDGVTDPAKDGSDRGYDQDCGELCIPNKTDADK